MTEISSRLSAALADRYAVERELGRGGMATVYLAEDLKHHRPVAIKVLDPELARALGADRFLREVEVTAKLTHPHILTLIDSGEADGFLYYVMPYIEGETLRDRMNREGQLPLDDALQITREVAAALSYAHSHDVIHRDIKPENVLLSAGEAVVADFGIARAITEAGGAHLTETGISIGTPAYMSPEQASGEERLDGRSDVYSLGCVLYEMLAGEPPYTGPSAQAIVAKKLSETTPRISVVRDLVPEAVERAVVKALAKAPADRFSTAARFVEALTTATGLDVGRAAVDRPRDRRRRAIIGLVGIVAVAVLATVVVRGLVGPSGEPTMDMSNVAVLLCANRTGDPTQGFMAAAVRDDVIDGLAEVSTLEVRGRRSAWYGDTALSYREIGRKLRVGSLVECSVYQAGDSLQVRASLIDALQDRVLWTARYQRPVAAMFRLGSDVARGVAEALNADVSSSEIARAEAPPTENQEAFTHYQRGRYLMNRWTPDGILGAIDHFEQAIALDSSFALAYAGLANALMLRGDVFGTGDIRPIEFMPRARTLVEWALDLDPKLADAHSVLGWVKFYYDYDYAGGERELRRATELDPASAAAWDGLAVCLSFLGRDDSALAAMRRAVELDPVEPWLLHDLSALLLLADSNQRALETANTVIELHPSLWASYSIAAAASRRLGNRDEAMRLLELVRDSSDHPVAIGEVGRAYARMGNREEALVILRELLNLREQRYVAPRAFASVYRGLDSIDTAMEYLIRAAETRDPSLQWDIRMLEEELREHPRYPELMRLMRLEE